MNILMLLDAEFDKQRVIRTIKLLNRQGYAIDAIERDYLRNSAAKRKPWPNKDVTIYRIPYLWNERVTRWITIPLFFNPGYLILTLSLLLKKKYHIIHVVNLPMLPLAVFWSKLFNIPVVFEQRDSYSMMYKLHISKRGGIWKFVDKLGLVYFLDKWSISKAKKVIVVCEEERDRLVNEACIPSERIEVIGNTVDLDDYPLHTLSNFKRLSYQEKPFTILYTGVFDEQRGLEVAVKGMKIVLQKIPARLVLVGDGRKTDATSQNGHSLARTRLEQLAVDLGIEKNIVFTGWVHHNEFANYIKESDLCIVPFRKDPHTDTTYPNKVFEFLVFGKPLVVSNTKPLKRIIVDEAKAGLYFTSGNVKEFAEVVIKMISSENMRAEMARNGQRIVLEKYNWGIDGKKLVALYNQLIEG